MKTELQESIIQRLETQMSSVVRQVEKTSKMKLVYNGREGYRNFC